MTNSKWLSALLAGTALTVASTAAMADTSMLTMTRNAAGEGVTFKVSPTADMPAAATEVTVAGEVRALLTSSKDDGADRVNDLGTRARVFVRGKTETAVGVVGAKFRIQDSGSQNATINQYTGYWEFAPGLTLTAGRTDTISAVVYGADWNGTQLFSGNGAGLTNQGFEQVNVAFSSGPVSFAIGLEDNSAASQFGAVEAVEADPAATPPVVAVPSKKVTKSNPAIAGTMNFSSGDFGAQIAGKTQSFKTGDTQTAGDNGYMIGGGLGYSAGGFGLSVGAATGRGLAADYVTFGADLVGKTPAGDLTDDKFTAMSVIGSFNMSETTSVEAWYGSATVSDFGATGTADAKVSGYGAGVFWNPVSQLRLGAGAGTTDYNTASGLNDNTTVGVGAWFKF